MTRTLHDGLLGKYAEYLSARGYTASKIPESTGRTPDLEVTGDGRRYLNEFKSPELLLDPAIRLFKFTTTNSKLLQFVHTALKQFTDYDRNHETPWVVTFASTHMQLHWHSLFEAMQGGSVVEGRVIADWTHTGAFKRWQANRYKVDLFMWLQVNLETGPYRASFFTNDRTPQRALIDGLVRDLRSRPLSNMDNNYLLV